MAAKVFRNFGCIMDSDEEKYYTSAPDRQLSPEPSIAPTERDTPEPAKEAEPSGEPEGSKEAEPSGEPAASKGAEPSGEPAASKGAEPSEEPEASKEAQASEEPEPSKEDEALEDETSDKKENHGTSGDEEDEKERQQFEAIRTRLMKLDDKEFDKKFAAMKAHPCFNEFLDKEAVPNQGAIFDEADLLAFWYVCKDIVKADFFGPEEPVAAAAVPESGGDGGDGDFVPLRNSDQRQLRASKRSENQEKHKKKDRGATKPEKKKTRRVRVRR